VCPVGGERLAAFAGGCTVLESVRRYVWYVARDTAASGAAVGRSKRLVANSQDAAGSLGEATGSQAMLRAVRLEIGSNAAGCQLRAIDVLFVIDVW
jgi:hypothetical protein